MFTYTDLHDELDSSFVEAVYYNADTKDAVVVLDSNNGYTGSEAYRYTSVPPQAVEDLVNAFSVGSYYNTNFKTVYGPAGHLGKFYPQDFVKADDNVTEVDFGSDATKEYSLGPVFDPTVSGAPLADASTEPTKEFPLTLVEDEADEDDEEVFVAKTTVHYVLNERKGKFVCEDDTTDVQDALDEFGEVITRLGLKSSEVKPTKVVFKFE
jgi:hypothetical protein